MLVRKSVTALCIWDSRGASKSRVVAFIVEKTQGVRAESEVRVRLHRVSDFPIIYVNMILVPGVALLLDF